MSFYISVYNLVRQIPRGQVASYGQIASLAGTPRAARQVGFALRSLGLGEHDVPWWRVVNKEGYLSINHNQGGEEKEVQRLNLEAEGVEVGDDFQIKNLAKFLWRP
jgi:methylated-DNA-protein-cysteine methyltransferase-like protein